MARRTIESLEAVKADWIVTAAASCAIAIMHDYADLLRDTRLALAGRSARRPDARSLPS